MTTSSISGYNSLLDYQSWVDSANSRTESMRDKIDSTSSTSSTSSNKNTSSSSSVDTSSSSVFLMNYQMSLTDLEAASSKLRLGEKDNVFSNYESALSKLSKASTDEERETAQAAVDKAKEDIVTAMNDFADKYNKTLSFLESNESRSATVSSQLSSMKSAVMTNNALKTVGMGMDVYGKIHVDEKELNKALDETYVHVKETMGGQFGIAERVGSKATSVLDSSVDRVLGNSKSSSGSTDSTDGTGKSSSSGSKSKSSALDSASMPDSLTSFYNFARSGAFNLSNYYAVGMLLNTVG